MSELEMARKIQIEGEKRRLLWKKVGC